MILHGFYHRDEARHTSRLARWKASTMTASEGEFFGLSYDQATARIVEGRALLQSILDREVEGFVAPAWLYSEGTRRALRDLGVRFAEDHLRVWSPVSGEVIHRSPVVSYASRDRRRIASSIVWSRSASTLLRPLAVVRHATHPHDFDVPALVGEIRRSLGGFLKRRQPAVDVLAAQGLHLTEAGALYKLYFNFAAKYV